MRDAVGDDIDIMVDCHARPSPRMGLRFAKALEPYGLYWFEEPCWPECVEGLAEVSGATEVRVNGAPAPISGGRFSASIELEEGPTRIVVTALALEASVEVWVDATAPRIIVESPEPASFIDGSQLRVRGRVEDIALTGLTVDGEDVPVTGEGRFEFARNVEPGVARLRLRAEDRAGLSAGRRTRTI